MSRREGLKDSLLDKENGTR